MVVLDNSEEKRSDGASLFATPSPPEVVDLEVQVAVEAQGTDLDVTILYEIGKSLR